MISKENFEKFGFFQKEKFLSQDLLNKLNNFFDKSFENTDQNVIKHEYIHLQNFKVLNRVFHEIRKTILNKLKINLLLRNVWMQRSYNDTIKKDLPYIPHIDKKRYFKLFLYLNDIKLENGPFTVSINSDIKKNEILRKNWWIKNQEGANHHDDRHGLLINDNELVYQKICLPAGSIVGFDTNCPHYASSIDKNCYRNVLRFNFYSTFNNKFSFSFLKKKILTEFKKFRT